MMFTIEHPNIYACLVHQSKEEYHEIEHQGQGGRNVS